MKVFLLNNTNGREQRVALSPAHVQQLSAAGCSVTLAASAGQACGWSDADYKAVGAQVVKRKLPTKPCLVIGVDSPRLEDIKKLPEGSTYMGFLDPLRQIDMLKTFADSKVDLISMDMVPRTTRAQKMDALSSQANLAGYEAVLLAAGLSKKAVPMMMTAAGTIQPSRYFVIGCGVAGLQAIATAKRLGARVEAFDTREAVAEQVKSLGARFVVIDLGKTEEVKGGYAGQLSEEQLEIQRKAMGDVCARSDVVIASANVFGRKAPTLVTAEMLDAMSPGAVVIDTAIETGGNVEGSELDTIVDYNGVKIVGYSSLASNCAASASQVYATNIVNVITEIFDIEASAIKDAQVASADGTDTEVLSSVVIVRDGQVVSPMVVEPYATWCESHTEAREPSTAQ